MFLRLDHGEGHLFIVVAGTQLQLSCKFVRLCRGDGAPKPVVIALDWPKVEHLRAAIAHWSERGDASFDPLFDALSDRALAPDDRLPSTGVGLDRERMLSASFIVSEGYGTRCSTVFAVTRDGEARFVERSFDAGGKRTAEVEQKFGLTPGSGIGSGSRTPERTTDPRF